MIKVGINGFGRIGRNIFRLLFGKVNDIQIVAINDIVDIPNMVHLLKYDTVYGRFGFDCQALDDAIKVGGFEIPVYGYRNPADIPWGDHEVDIVIESTGKFRTREGIIGHIEGTPGHVDGAKKVLLTVPSKTPEDVDATVVMGVNHNILTSEMNIISNASCTTNCLAPVALALHEAFGITGGIMTTIHGYTSDQRIVDLPHTDLRRARAAATNAIPTKTGAAKAIGLVIPDLDGLLAGKAVRIPIPCGSAVDLTVLLEKDVSVEELNAAIKSTAVEMNTKANASILEYCTDPIVSSDIIGNQHSSIFDSLLTIKVGKLYQVFSWYDNERGYATRCLDLIRRMMVV